MLLPGLAASWKAGLRLGSTSLLFTASAPASSRCATPTALAVSRSSIGTCIPSHRPLTTSSNLLARLAPLSRRRDPLARSQPSLTQDLDSSHPHHPPPSSAQQPSIPRALLFLLVFSTLTFTSAAYYSLLDTQRIASRLSTSRDVFSNISSYFHSNDASSSRSTWGSGVDERRLTAAKNQATAERLGLRMEWIMRHCEEFLPAPVCEFVGRTYLIVAEKYLNLSAAQKVVVPVVAVNTAVFAMWSVASIGRRGGKMLGWMTRNFVHRPSANRSRTLVTSVFSHQSFLHFTFNNLALWSIGGSALYLSTHISPSAVGEASPTPHFLTHISPSAVGEASPTPHFLAFFSTAGVFAATVSHIVTAIRFKRISAIHGLAFAKETLGRHASLGASGAVYSALVMSAFAFPEAKLGVILLPWITVNIGVGVVGLVLMDAVGVWRGWRMFDHWAHLAGAAFGAGHWFAGAEVWDWLKRRLVERMREGGELE